MASEASLKRLRAKYGRTPPPVKPVSVSDRSWSIFLAYIYEQRAISDLATGSGLSISRVRQILHSIDHECSFESPNNGSITQDSPIEHLPLSVRARNSLHKAGCSCVRDILNLNLAGSIRRMGPATRSEVLAALKSSGFRHPSIDLPVSDLVMVAQGLERAKTRIDVALRTVSKELSALQERLRRKMGPVP